MARSKAFGAFADSFSRSFGMGANIAMQQKRLGEEYAWRQQQENTRKQELQDRIKRQDKIRAEDVSYREERDTKADTRYQEGLEQRKEDRKERAKQAALGRGLQRELANIRATALGEKSTFDVSERSRLRTAQSMMSMIEKNEYMEPSVKVPAARAVHEYYIKDNLTPKTLESLVEAYRASLTESMSPADFNKRFFSDVLAPLGIIQNKAGGQ